MREKQRPAIVKTKLQFMAIKLLAIFEEIALSPAAVIDRGRNRIALARGSKHISDQAFIVSAQWKIHRPSVIGAPVPVKYLFTSSGKPVPFDVFPQPGNAVAQFILYRIICLKILFGGQEALEQE